jgi:putative Mg2+ transporter-C (MgtC) family protein
MEQDLWILLRLGVAALFSGLIGYERERTKKEAGLRTHMLVAVGAALVVSFVELTTQMAPRLTPANAPEGFRYQITPISTIEAVMTGIGFLGAGTIFMAGSEERVKGLTTAASIWLTAAIGIAVGLERYVLAFGATLLALFILRVLRSIG